MSELDPIQLSVTGVQNLVESKVNKTADGVLGQDEGVESEKEDILSLKLDDAELLELRNLWESKYAGYEAAINKRQKANLAYYMGRQAEGSAISASDAPLASNILFEALETFLPAALSKNPDPVVYSDNSQQGNDISDAVKTMLQFHADQLALRSLLTLMTRQWAMYFLGVIKHGWNKDLKDITSEVRKIQDFIFDPNGFVDVHGDFQGYLGERITVSAERLVELFPEHESYIKLKVDYKMGTDCTYTEWWTDEYTFSTFKDIILDKSKNPYFKYDEQAEDHFGIPMIQKGSNHFAKPKKPYTFLAVFSLGDRPHDLTGLIEQNIPNQNLITKRTYQIDRNLSRSNNSVVYSEDNFTQETAKQASNALEKGNPVLVPSGAPIDKAIVRLPAEGFPAQAFEELENNKLNLRTIFGTQGITAQEPNEDTTARGMILNQQYDNSRIGGGIGDRIAEAADNVFNYWTQLYYVYYDEPHFAAIMGQMKAVEYETFSAQDLDRQLIVTVAPDSMKPKDETSVANQALELFQQKAIGPKTLLTLLNFPNVDESAADGVLYAIDPQAYLQMNWPELSQQLQQMQQQQMQMEQQAQMAQQQQQMALEGQAGQQQLQQTGAASEQKLAHGQAAHEQKMSHAEEMQKQKIKLAGQKPASTGGASASASLSKVKLPK